MAVLTLNVPGDKVTRFLAATKYQATIKDEQGNDIPNPISPLVHSKNWILDIIRNQILRYEAGVASEAASNTALNQDLSDID